MSDEPETSETPAVAQAYPYETRLEAGKRYAWCACGLSDSQPFCDGSHKRTGGKHRPVVFTAEESGTVYLCGCKRSGDKPYYDGTHNTL